MATLTYWLAEQNDDSECYSIVAKTKKECLALITKRIGTNFEAPRKVIFEYKDAFDLFEWMTSEAGGRHQR